MTDDLPEAYWDSSALIPLCVSQPQSPRSRTLYDTFTVVTWWASRVEMISGLTRLERMGQISHDQFVSGKKTVQEIARVWSSVQSPLRAADAIQLAAAHAACDYKPERFVLITADQRLEDAARRSGFAVEYVV
jgi:predicted nucleic acid-binding protein